MSQVNFFHRIVPLLPEQMTAHELTSEIKALEDWFSYCDIIGRTITTQETHRIEKCRSQLMTIVMGKPVNPEISKVQIKFGVIETKHLYFWGKESEPLFDLNSEDHLNNIFPKTPVGRIFNSSGYLAEETFDGLVVVKKSPYYTYGNLLDNDHAEISSSTSKGTIKCYCLPQLFYYSYKIPHDIYLCENDELVHKNKWVKMEND